MLPSKITLFSTQYIVEKMISERFKGLYLPSVGPGVMAQTF